MKKKYILLVPVGGLANRMKAIDSAIKLSRKTNSELHIIWFKDRGFRPIIRTDRFTECKNNGGYMERLPALRQAPAEKYFHSQSFSKGNLR